MRYINRLFTYLLTYLHDSGTRTAVTDIALGRTTRRSWRRACRVGSAVDKTQLEASSSSHEDMDGSRRRFFRGL